MKWLRCLALLLCLGSLSCTSDGGPVGSGISSTAVISGNVVDVQGSAVTGADAATAALPPIRVSIDGLPDVGTMADDSGNFVLSGSFAGTLTLRYTVPQFEVTQPIDVPAGSTIVMQDIDLQADGVVVQALRQLAFFGVVDVVDCADGTLLVHERRSGGMQYDVQLTDQTSLVDLAGRTQVCSALQVGSTVIVEGTIASMAPAGSITALTVTLSPIPPPSSPSQIAARFVGAVAAVDCTAGLVVVDDSVQRTTVRLTAQTQLVGVAACADLQLGDPVRGQGEITLRMPGVIAAARFAVVGSPTAGQLRFVGFAAVIDCGNGLLELRDDGTRIDVQLTPQTVIRAANGQPLGCSDIQPGDRVAGLGQIAPDASWTLNATQITLRHRALENPLAR